MNLRIWALAHGKKIWSTCGQSVPNLDVPLEVVSLQKEYWDQVVAYTIAEVKAGRTPNPDVLCNSRIKFGAFIDAIDSSYERIASGHYARLERTDTGVALCVTPDPIKDQTYFLSQLIIASSLHGLNFRLVLDDQE